MSTNQNKDKSSMDYLIEQMEKKDVKIVFGLEAQGHLPTIEKILKKWNTTDPEIGYVDMTYDKHVWEEIGKEIGWCPFTAALSYFKIKNMKI